VTATKLICCTAVEATTEKLCLGMLNSFSAQIQTLIAKILIAKILIEFELCLHIRLSVTANNRSLFSALNNFII